MSRGARTKLVVYVLKLPGWGSEYARASITKYTMRFRDLTFPRCLVVAASLVATWHFQNPENMVGLWPRSKRQLQSRTAFVHYSSRRHSFTTSLFDASSADALSRMEGTTSAPPHATILSTDSVLSIALRVID